MSVSSEWKGFFFFFEEESNKKKGKERKQGKLVCLFWSCVGRQLELIVWDSDDVVLSVSASASVSMVVLFLVMWCDAVRCVSDFGRLMMMSESGKLGDCVFFLINEQDVGLDDR